MYRLYLGISLGCNSNLAIVKTAKPNKYSQMCI